MSTLILIYYNLYQSTKLKTNALDKVVAGILSQLNIDKDKQ